MPSRPPALASCIMPTANRRQFVPHAIRLFLAQDYPGKELLILDDGEESVEDLVPPHPQIRYIRLAGRASVGAKRNRACEEASGEVVVHWDDDDWSAPWRLRYQVRALLAAGADLCGLARVLFADFAARRAWEYVYPQDGRAWVHGATLCYRKRLWQRNAFPEGNVGEDSHFVWNAHGARLLALPDNRFFVGVVHDGNTSPKRVREAHWRPRPMATIQAVLGTTAWDRLARHHASRRG